MAKKKGIIIIYILVALLGFATILVIPASREVFIKLSGDVKTKYIMGFLKFALLATAGELLSTRLAKKEWVAPPKVVARFIIWGFIGVWITFMMGVFFTAAGTGILPLSDNPVAAKCLRAFYTSVMMNTSFGPTFMAVHKCSDRYLELRAEGNRKPALSQVVGSIDWSRFVSFTIFKTVPLFWIPAHTVTFMLPQEYQVIMAAALSVALGIILNIKK